MHDIHITKINNQKFNIDFNDSLKGIIKRMMPGEKIVLSGSTNLNSRNQTMVKAKSNIVYSDKKLLKKKRKIALSSK